MTKKKTFSSYPQRLSILVSFVDGEKKLEFGRNVVFRFSKRNREKYKLENNVDTVKKTLNMLADQGKRSISTYIKRIKEEKMYEERTT